MATPTITGTVVNTTTAASVVTLSTTNTIASGLTGSMFFAIATNPNSRQPGSATWMGTPMTSLGFTAGILFKQAFYINNPAPGTGACTITWSAFSHDISMITFTVKDGGVIDQKVQQAGFPFGNMGSLPITTTANDELVISMFDNDGGATQSQNAGQTLLSDTVSNGFRTTVSSKSAPTAGTIPMGVSFSAIIDWDAFTIAIGAGSSFTPQILIL